LPRLPSLLLCLSLLSTLLLVSCARSDSLLSDYTTRLARSLQVDRPPIPEGDPPVLPRLRELRQPLTESSINLLDFLALGSCELQGVIAERNSSLGRLATPTTRLVHELEFLDLADDCVASLPEDEADLIEELQAVIATKERELPIVIFNATLGGEEFRAFWRWRAREIVIDADALDSVRTLKASVASWMKGDYGVDREALTNQLNLIRRGPGGDYLQYWADLSRYLAVADDTIEARKKPLCFENMKTPQADIFNNVVMQFFIGGVQKEVAVLSRGSFDLLQEVDELESLLVEALPGNYQDWRDQRRSLVADGSAAMGRHVKALEPLLSSCGFLPGAV